MAHKMHTVEGLVLGGVDTGEAHRYLSLYTRELGLVRAAARSAREERSRLRYHLQDFSYGHFRLVRGREVWRITGAHEMWNAYRACANDREKVRILAHACLLVRRLVTGEEANTVLWDAFSGGVLFLRDSTLGAREVLNFEYVFMLRILHALGYVRNAPHIDALLTERAITAEHLATLSPLRRKLAAEINHALRESQL